MTETVIHSTTQKFLDIFDITNNLVILKDGTASLIIQVDAMNFGLLAEEEQDSIMYAYAGLLNSLNYPIQIIIRSQTKDVTGYLGILKEQEDTAGSREKQQRIRRYREFVSNLIKERNVLDKKFYVAITATPLELGMIAPQSFIPGKSDIKITGEERTAVIEKARNLLEPKRDHLLAQFARIGLFSRQLTTQEMIQYFYISYNPEAAEGQQIADTNNYTTPLVTAGLEGINTMNATQIPTPPPQPTIANTAANTSGVAAPTEMPAMTAPVVPTPAITPEAQLEQVPAGLLPQEPAPVAPIEKAAPEPTVIPTNTSTPAYSPTVMAETSGTLTPPVPTPITPEPSATIHHAATTPLEMGTDTQVAPTPVATSVAPSSEPVTFDLPKPTPPPMSAPVTETPSAAPIVDASIQAAIDTTLGQITPGTPMDTTPAPSPVPTPNPTNVSGNATLPPLPEI